MRADVGVLGIFADPEGAARAVRALRDAGHARVQMAAPAPYPPVVEALGRPASRLGRVTMSAAVLGTAAGFALCIATSIAWPLVTGGKPIVSVPPFVIIAFEISVLVGALANLAGLLYMAARGRRRSSVPYDPRLSADRIGILVAGADPANAEAILRHSGAEEVRRVG